MHGRMDTSNVLLTLFVISCILVVVVGALWFFHVDLREIYRQGLSKVWADRQAGNYMTIEELFINPDNYADKVIRIKAVMGEETTTYAPDSNLLWYVSDDKGFKVFLELPEGNGLSKDSLYGIEGTFKSFMYNLASGTQQKIYYIKANKMVKLNNFLTSSLFILNVKILDKNRIF